AAPDPDRAARDAARRGATRLPAHRVPDPAAQIRRRLRVPPRCRQQAHPRPVRFARRLVRSGPRPPPRRNHRPPVSITLPARAIPGSADCPFAGRSHSDFARYTGPDSSPDGAMAVPSEVVTGKTGSERCGEAVASTLLVRRGITGEIA